MMRAASATGDSLGQRHVSRVARTVGDDMGVQPAPEKGQVADDVADLVAQELVVVAQAFVEHTVLVQDDRVIERGAHRQAAGVQRLGIGLEAEGPCRSELSPKRRLVDDERSVLTTDAGVVEVDRGRDA
jgi:hypothetical protein